MLLLRTLAQKWWLLLLRGLAAIAFGLITLAWPGVTMLSLILVYGIYAVADGVIALMAACTGGTIAPRWWLVLSGLLGLVAGGLALTYPGLTAVVLVTLIGAWCILHGLFEVIGAVQLRKQIDHEWMLILSGVLSIFFGMLILAAPLAGAVVLLWWIAAYALVVGVLLVGFSLRLRRHRPYAHA